MVAERTATFFLESIRIFKRKATSDSLKNKANKRPLEAARFHFLETNQHFSNLPVTQSISLCQSRLGQLQPGLLGCGRGEDSISTTPKT